MDVQNVALHKKNKVIVEIPNADEPLLRSREENPKRVSFIFECYKGIAADQDVI